jgi:hypothetical protein
MRPARGGLDAHECRNGWWAVKILVCGGRDYADRVTAFAVLDAMRVERDITAVVHGACSAQGRTYSTKLKMSGADRWAHEWAVDNKIAVYPIPADWTKYGHGGGPVRNVEMLDTHPDIGLVVAFKGGAGTANMKALAKARGIPVEDTIL